MERELSKRFDWWLFGLIWRLIDRPLPPPACSFCRKPEASAGYLVEGPGRVFICESCIGLCQSIVEQRKRRPEPP